MSHSASVSSVYLITRYNSASNAADINKAQFQPYGAVVINVFVRAACTALNSGQLATNVATKVAPIQNGDMSSDENDERKLMERVLGARRAGSDSDGMLKSERQ